jgi:hypothetical protein
MSVSPPANPPDGTEFNRTMFVPTERPAIAYIIPERAYNRVQGRIRDEMGRADAPIWLAIAFTFVGVALTTLVSWILTPKKVTGLPAGTKNNIGFIALASLIISIISGYGYYAARRRSRAMATDICSEMDTYTARGD